MEDDEDSKAKVIIDGFEYVIDNELNKNKTTLSFLRCISRIKIQRYNDVH